MKLPEGIIFRRVRGSELFREVFDGMPVLRTSVLESSHTFLVLSQGKLATDNVFATSGRNSYELMTGPKY